MLQRPDDPGGAATWPPPPRTSRAGADRYRRRVSGLLLVLILVLSGVAAGSYLTHRHPQQLGHHSRQTPAARLPEQPPGQQGQAPGRSGPGSRGGTPPPQPAALARGTVPPPAASPAARSQISSAPPAVACQSDLPASESPNAPYSFLCTEGGRPLTWPRGRVITLYTAGLTPVQSAALP